MTLSKTLFTFLLLMLFTLGVKAQCPFERENCTGECGRFIDEDNDGFCDFGLVTQPVQKGNSGEQNPDNEVKQESKTKKDNDVNTTVAQIKETDNSESDFDAISSVTSSPDIMENEPVTNAIDEIIPSAKQTHKKPYDFLSISIITIILYILSMLLVKMKKMKKVTHRKIWNVILLVSFLVSGILGLILVIQINYGFAMSAFRQFLFLHVEFGIVMAIIAVIHAFWHLSYYKKIFRK